MKDRVNRVKIAFVCIFFLVMTLYLYPSIALARITPEDIVNEKRRVYNLRVSQYSSSNKQKLELLEKKIAEFNKSKTQELEKNMLSQGQILEEYIRRQEIKEQKTTDGINRNLSDPIENARYWVTYAHEAVAYQAAKIYIFDLTGEVYLKRDANNIISVLENDLNILRNKVIKSQKIIQGLINE